ncbi:hypothetical protein CIL05_05335 [Virgibacillus profundi]|uniref:Uncharacterized protein n=1 Tax=Virgibacillus profundi TaxID=2024555 RepID=A0A2A2IHD3_9BACI|nr:hypothetical protein [Virgibacillus profundi]PAV30525.1 hypothetical protein CIL05_05335 [Virgibacillus profundi]PXY54697.1 hypothetical protein CIT14_05420 [Virgibacillus profundi]
MNRFLKLVNFELGRFMKIYLALIGITIISQIAGVIIKSNSYVERANEAIYEDLIPKEDFFATEGLMSMLHVLRSVWFMGPIALCIAALIFYVFFIWYRDWFGKNTFIYRLLMLPTARIQIFLSKAVSILLMVFGLVAIQLILLPIESVILKWIVPLDYRIDMTVGEIIQNFRELQMLIPSTFIEFVLYYGAGMMAVFIIFTAILFERSFRLKGILFGAIFVGLAVLVFFSPILIMEIMQTYYLYPIEIFILEIILGLVVIGASIWTSHFLLKKKITV